MAQIGVFQRSHNILLPSLSFNGARCCSSSPSRIKKKQTQAPKFLKFAVNGVTELLRLFSPDDQDRKDAANRQLEESLVSDIDDVLLVIKSDYEKAYFVTGLFTSSIYADDCTFEDPTIKFRGRDLYSRNLKLLVPYLDNPSIFLKKIEKGTDSETENIVATWRLRTHLKFPWRPLISVDGSTVYVIDEQLRVVWHVESWEISALEVVGQIFTPGFMSSRQ